MAAGGCHCHRSANNAIQLPSTIQRFKFDSPTAPFSITIRPIPVQPIPVQPIPTDQSIDVDINLLPI